MDVTSTLLRKEMLVLMGIEVEVTAWSTRMAGMPLVVTEMANDEGDVVQMLIESGTGLIEAIVSTKESALAAAAAETSAPELVDSTHVVLAQPIPELHSWMRSKRALLTVKTVDDEPLILPDAGFQHVTAATGKGMRFT